MIILSNIGARVDLSIVRNAAFARTFTHKTNGVATNLSGYTFTAQVRLQDGTLQSSFTTAIVNAASGTFSVSLSAAQTNALTQGVVYEWSLEQSVGGIVSELVRGYVQVVVNEVTA